MLHIATAFENSLRGRDVASPSPKKKNQAHSSCSGTEKSPFQRSSSNRWSRRSMTKEAAAKKPENNCSESDSLDSLGGKTKSTDTADEANKKSDSVCARLFKGVTKASAGKTVQMRHLDIFDVDENSWIGGLRKPGSDDADKALRSRQTSENGSVKDSQENGISRSRNGSFRRSSNGEVQQENGFSRSRNGSLRKGDRQGGLGKASGARDSFRRRSSRVNIWQRNKKTNGFFNNVDKSNCFKDLEEIMQHRDATEYTSIIKKWPSPRNTSPREKQWLDAEKVWLMHRGGFAAARQETDENQEPGKLKVRLEATGDALCVDEDDIEKANPPQFDRAEDLASLRHLNESSVLHTLRQRYATNLIHTYAGSGTLLVVNPMAPLAIYSEKVVSLFKGCKSEDMPPHIYSMAQSSYHAMLSTRRDQSLVFLGRSGSGKTTNFRHCVQYLVTAAGASNKVLSLEKLTALWTVLESFGNCKTAMNTNATRFTQIFSLDFDQSGAVGSASVQALMLERTRIARKVDNETTFHVMQRLLSGVEGTLRKELYLENLSGNENNPFMSLPQKHEEKQRAQQEFVKLCGALNVLGVSEAEQRSVYAVLAAIFHLGCAGAVKGKNLGH
ncbi:hypothetical protein NQ318_014995 [Aromia moschata]|uniref:Myosin motor domain-containing protein n=1 Tax=Aromia moschata TaxID=1265417 RepID=A0AAV8YZQ4_9CUCU|nr:hypothetical protein NQ318_014995 [Aromia moschata]